MKQHVQLHIILKAQAQHTIAFFSLHKLLCSFFDAQNIL